jgi:phage tail-like protein
MAGETDPVVSYPFSVVIDSVVVDRGVNASGRFTGVSGLQGENDVVVDRRVVGDGKELVQMIPGRVRWSEIIFTKGVTLDMGFWVWRAMVVEGKIEDARANMTVTMYDRNSTAVMHWNFLNAWPSKLSGPSLDSGSGDFALEEMIVQHEGMKRDGSAGDPV